MGVYMFYFMFAAILSSRQKYVTLNPHLVCLCNLPLFCFHHPVFPSSANVHVISSIIHALIRANFSNIFGVLQVFKISSGGVLIRRLHFRDQKHTRR